LTRTNTCKEDVVFAIWLQNRRNNAQNNFGKL